MSDLLKSKAALILGAGALTAAGIAYFVLNKKDQHLIERGIFADRFDQKLHNLERLREIMEDYFYEVVQNHLQICLFLRAVKVQGKYKPEILHALKGKI